LISRKYSIIQFGAIVLSIVMGSHSSAVEFSGQVALETRLFFESAAYAQQHADNSSLSIQPEIYHESKDGSSNITFVPFFRLDEGDKQRTHADIRELSWVKLQDELEWRIGVRKVFWGVTESQHLVDIINQTDNIESIDQEEKLGQPMINLSYTTDIGSFDFFVLPYFRERTFASIQGRLRSQPYVDSSKVFYESNDKEKHIDYAFRWAHSVEEWDLGFSYFSGTSRAPRFVVGTDSNGITVLNPYYDIINQLGLDIQATYESWLWKLETIHRSGVGSNNDSYWAFTGGLEYTFYSLIGEATDLGLVIEYSRDDRGVDATSPMQKDIMLGLRFNLNDEQSTDMLIGMISDIDSDAITYSIEANRRLTDNIKLSLEAKIFSDIPSSDVLFPYLKDDYFQVELFYYF